MSQKPTLVELTRDEFPEFYKHERRVIRALNTYLLKQANGNWEWEEVNTKTQERYVLGDIMPFSRLRCMAQDYVAGRYEPHKTWYSQLRSMRDFPSTLHRMGWNETRFESSGFVSDGHSMFNISAVKGTLPKYIKDAPKIPDEINALKKHADSLMNHEKVPAKVWGFGWNRKASMDTALVVSSMGLDYFDAARVSLLHRLVEPENVMYGHNVLYLCRGHRVVACCAALRIAEPVPIRLA